MYIVSVSVMGCLDYGVTRLLISVSVNSVAAKFIAAIIGILGNFILRRWLVFSDKK
jgi:putative flippase GtrA